MGGMGSGRGPSARPTRGMIRLDLAQLHRKGVKPKAGTRASFVYSSGGERVLQLKVHLHALPTEDAYGGASVEVVAYRQGARAGSRRQHPDLEETATRFGGRRLWFTCSGCRRRCRVLFSETLRCRKCVGMSYASENMTRTARVCDQMHKLRRRLNAGENAYDLPDKPPRMHWSTNNRLADRHEAYEERWAAWVLPSRPMPSERIL